MKPMPPADYAPANRVEQYRHLALACERGDCIYTVVPSAEPKPRRYGHCDGWRGTVYHEDCGPVLRVRACDRRLAWERARKAAKAESGGKSGAAESWRK